MADFQADQFEKYDMEQYQKYDTACCNVQAHPLRSAGIHARSDCESTQHAIAGNRLLSRWKERVSPTDPTSFP